MAENNKEQTMGCKVHRMLMFYIPFLYAIETRFLKRSKLGVIVWATEYLIPLFLTLFLVATSVENGWYWLIATMAVYNFYEIGYIQNDCETIKKESHPTLRVSTAELRFYERTKVLVYSWRLLLGCGLSVFFYLSGIALIAIIVLWCVVPFYMLYNHLRGRINLYLILPLTTYRYCMPLFLCPFVLNARLLACALLFFIAYPLLKFVEVCAGGKDLPQEPWTRLLMKSFESRFAFRIKYYLVLTLCLVAISFYCEVFAWLWLIPLYYLLLRIPQLKMKKLGAR